jgi:energy-coupling factor transporter ATP-binding protein EcfA2
MSNPNAVMIEARAVEKWYPNGFHALRGVDLSVHQGEVVVIMGPSGSGKSTFLRTFNALEDFQQGSIVVDGIALNDDLRQIDAVRREGARLTLIRFLLPGEVAAAVIDPSERWNELWAADRLRRRYPVRCARADIVAWPLVGDPQLLTPEGVDHGPLLARRRRLQGLVATAAEAWRASAPTPQPDYHCRECRVADLCRQGMVT